MRFLYTNTKNIYPQDRHLIDGLLELGHEVVEICEEGAGAATRIHAKIQLFEGSYDAIFVGFTSPLFVIAARRAAPRATIIFNAVTSQYEANIISRGEVGHFFINSVKWWLVDFLSFHLSTKVLLESNAQISFVRKLFFMSKNKLVRAFSGLDEKEFFFDPSIPKAKDFTVVFRGRFLPESGILTVIETAKKIENSGVIVRIMGEGFMYREVNALIAKLQPKNLDMINKTLPFDELRKKMLECHVSLGQMADHPRLKRTLPCKLFESLALKLPYLTGRNKAVFEILEEGVTCMASSPGDADDLAKKILYLRDNPEVRDRIANAGYGLYKKSLASKVLAKDVLDACFK